MRQHCMHVEIIDEYVDAHLPQTYLEKWGSYCVANAAQTVREGTCEYRAPGRGCPGGRGAGPCGTPFPPTRPPRLTPSRPRLSYNDLVHRREDRP